MTIKLSGPEEDVMNETEGPMLFKKWILSCNGEAAPLSLEVYKPFRSPQYFGMVWSTALPAQQGLKAIRESYQRIKEDYVEPRSLPKMSLVDLISFKHKRGPVEFFMQGHENPTAVSLDVFLRPDSFNAKADGANLLSWIRVNTEYLDYFFDAERGLSRQAGVMGLENMSGEVMLFYKATSSITLPENDLVAVGQTLDRLLSHFPTLTLK